MATTRLPLLPGFSVQTKPRTNFAKSQYFGVSNGTRTDGPYQPPPPRSMELPAAQRVPTQFDVTTKSRAGDESLRKQPDWVKYDKQVLRYYGYFKERVFDSSVERHRVRKFIIYYYLEDGSIRIAESKEDNSGIPQGVFLKRSRIQRADGSGPLSYEDFRGCKVLSIYGREFTIVNADAKTRRFMESKNTPFGTVGKYPNDAFTTTRKKATNKEARLGANEVRTFVEASLGKTMSWQHKKTRKFLANDKKVLRFDCVWEDHRLYGEKHKYILHYFLADDTVEIREVQKANSGRDPFPLLLTRQRLPKKLGGTQIGQAESDNVEYYDEYDLYVGATISVFNRQVQLVKADPYTVKFYTKELKMDPSKFIEIPVEFEEKKAAVQHVPPPYNGFGTEEDSMGSVRSLEPRPPRKDYTKLAKYDKTCLRFLGKLHDPRPEDVAREFLVMFYMSDDTVMVFERQVRNSGFTGGKFLARTKLRNPVTREFFRPDELYVGATVTLNGFKFRLLESDEMTLKFMEGDPRGFPKSDIKQIAIQVAQRMATAEQSREEIFQKYDKNADGTLSPSEFVQMAEDQGWNLDEHMVLTVFRSYDRSKDGVISMREFFDEIDAAASGGALGMDSSEFEF